MEQRQTSLYLCLLLLFSVARVITGADRVNKSSWEGMVWAEEDTDLLKRLESEELSMLGSSNNINNSEQGDLGIEFDGGFSSLDSMLQWAIGHSDPAKLKETAQNVQHLSASELNKRQGEIKELMEKMKMPSDAQLMQIAITDLNNSSLSLEDHHRALQELLHLVESIDNANDMNKLGGLAVVIRELDNSDPEIRTMSAWILGKASQNNPVVQKQVLELGAVIKLMKMIKSSSVEEGIKSLYAVSALIRNNVNGQELFYSLDGHGLLQDIMSNSSTDVRLRKKSAFLVADLAEYQLESRNKAEFPFFSNDFFLKSVVDLTASTDMDLQEKALMAIKSLLKLRTTEALVFKNFCSLDEVLERIKEQLQQSMTEEYLRDFAQDMESLRREVELIFHTKLEQVTSVPT